MPLNRKTLLLFLLSRSSLFTIEHSYYRRSRFLCSIYIYIYTADSIYIVYVIESAAYGVICPSCLCQKPERARYEKAETVMSAVSYIYIYIVKSRQMATANH